MEKIHLVECPRDAWQGLGYQVPTVEKANYIAQLLKCGFHTLDCGSFVNPTAVPQMADTAELLQHIGDLKGNTRLLVIVANERGAKDAAFFPAIDDLGFPFSINETFQQRNANSNLEEAYDRLGRICDIAAAEDKNVVAYLSMAFGNPYNEPYHREDVLLWAEKIQELGVNTMSLADTVGTAKSEDVAYLFKEIHRLWPQLEIGAHFHAKPDAWSEKIDAAFQNGCRRFDGAILGFGGCPFANDELTGNIPTEGLIQWFSGQAIAGVNILEMQTAMNMANGIFNRH